MNKSWNKLSVHAYSMCCTKYKYYTEHNSIAVTCNGSTADVILIEEKWCTMKNKKYSTKIWALVQILLSMVQTAKLLVQSKHFLIMYYKL